MTTATETIVTPTLDSRPRRIERDLRDYSLRLLVDELRREARVSWKVMHQCRRIAACTQDPERRCQEQHMELMLRQRLSHALSLLNAGLGRDGSLDATYRRRLRRDSEVKA